MRVYRILLRVVSVVLITVDMTSTSTSLTMMRMLIRIAFVRLGQMRCSGFLRGWGTRVEFQTIGAYSLQSRLGFWGFGVLGFEV